MLKTETPIELLELKIKQIQNNIVFYKKPNTKGVQLPDALRKQRVAEYQADLKLYKAALQTLKNTVTHRLVIQTKDYDHGCQVIQTSHVYMHLTEKQKEILSEVFDTSDKVLSFIFGKKVGGNTNDDTTDD